MLPQNPFDVVPIIVRCATQALLQSRKSSDLSSVSIVALSIVWGGVSYPTKTFNAAGYHHESLCPYWFCQK